MRPVPRYEFHVARAVRERCGFDDALFALSGNVVLADPAAARRFAARLTLAGGAPASPADLFAMGLIDEVLHLAVARFREQRDPRAIADALGWFEARLGRAALDRTLLAFAERFPVVEVHRGRRSAASWLAGATGGVPHREVAFEELMLLALANENPAFAPYAELFDDAPLRRESALSPLVAALHDYFETRPRFGPASQNLLDVLRAPARAARTLEDQLAFLREHWGWLLGDLLARLAVALDVLAEDARHLAWLADPARALGAVTGDSSAAGVPGYSGHDHEFERFSPDEAWMPGTVMIAKSTHVWLDQLARTHGRTVNRLDEIPDSALDELVSLGINALWLIGLWERSPASQEIKRRCGNPDAVASAYSLYDYAIAADLGGDDAYGSLRDRAAARGIRLASDMVPNHMGIDSRWLIEHPEWFLSLDHSPYPSYSFRGADLSNDGRVALRIEDHYYDRSDAAVVFQRVDRASGETRYVYHGNDGTSFPWNDTAQLDYLRADVREQVIRTILDVARRFPIIRFDAAMTLAKRHIQRLWYPDTGAGGGIPSRAGHGVTGARFEAAIPREFWREVVDRVAIEAPGTLLLAEAFWLMEGYFVRTLGMHRVYNSAFMNMLRDEANANYRRVLKNTLEFEPEILQRYVNFMNNPDERTAVDQFGKGEKYFGVCALLATLPGLPMFGHGQFEGFEEKYGMEFRRARRVEHPDEGLVAEHRRRIAPLLHRRALFAQARHFLLYDCFAEGGGVNEDVFAYSNRDGYDRALVVYHNRYAHASGWLRVSAAFAERAGDGERRLGQRTLAEGLALPGGDALVRCRDIVTGGEFLFTAQGLREAGMRVELGAYESRVFLDWREVLETGRPWRTLERRLRGRGVPSLDDALRELELVPVHGALRAALAAAPASAERAAALLLGAAQTADAGGWTGDALGAARRFAERLRAAERLAALEPPRRKAWPAEARDVLPLAADARPETVTAVRAWAALELLGEASDPDAPRAAALGRIDSLRLRGVIAEALREQGAETEDAWRIVARLRAALRQPPPSGEPGASARRPARMALLDDDEVRWLIGVHEHDGVRWIRREDFERLAWWLEVSEWLAIAATPDPARLARLIERVSRAAAEARAAGWRYDDIVRDAPVEAPDA